MRPGNNAKRNLGMGTLEQANNGFNRTVDVGIVLLSALLVHRLYFDDLNIVPVRMIVLLFSIGATYTFFALGGLYASRDQLRLGEVLSRLTVCFALMVLATGLFAFLSKIAIDVSRFWFGAYLLTAYIGLCGYRVAHRIYLIWLRKQGRHSQSIVIAGSGALCSFTLKRLHEHMWAGINVDAVFDDHPRDGIEGVELSGALQDIPAHVEQRRHAGMPIDQVWVALPLKEEEAISELVESLKDSSVDICVIPSAFANQLISGTQFHVADLAVVNVSEVHLTPFGEWFKIAFDYVAAFCAVILFMPIMLVIGVLIKLDSPGNIIFKQRRYGIDGQEIEVWKFRTMSVAQDGIDVPQATANDARVTRIGRFLRRTSLDELPQFFNVLQGRMSVVGPRPHAVSHNEEYRKKIHGYMMRHKIKPGITGWAQVNGWRGETDTLEKMENRVRYDLEYIKNWSAWLDIKIVWLTILHGFNNKNAY